MSEGKHTPRPWTVLSDEAVTVRDAKDGSVATIGWLTGRGVGPRRSSAEVHANARLIAAAPDLYEALKFLLAHCKGMDRFEGNPINQAMADARAALAKAQGE